MEVIVLPSITVETERYLQTMEEGEEHEQQIAVVLEKNKSKILSKNRVGILEVKSRLKGSEQMIGATVYIISPDADNYLGPIHAKIIEYLTKKGFGFGGMSIAGLDVSITGGSFSKIKELLEKFV